MLTFSCDFCVIKTKLSFLFWFFYCMSLKCHFWMHCSRYLPILDTVSDRRKNAVQHNPSINDRLKSRCIRIDLNSIYYFEWTSLCVKLPLEGPLNNVDLGISAVTFLALVFFCLGVGTPFKAAGMCQPTNIRKSHKIRNLFLILLLLIFLFQ